MDIDDLKNLWKRKAEDFQPRHDAEIAAMLKGRSSGIVARLKRSVWFELIFTLVAGIALFLYALTLPAGALKWISIAILLSFCAYCVYYIKKLTLLSRFEHVDADVRASLVRLVDTLNSYLRFYRRSYAVLYPAYFILAILFGALETNFEAFYSRITRPSTALALIGLAILLLVVSTWFTSWYLKKLYGKHLARLENIIEELDQ